MEKADYDFVYAGENLAINFEDSSEVSSAWMNSPKHKENILNGNFTEIGIATEKGFYNGKETIFVVQMFGSPKKALTSAPESSPISLVSRVINEKELALDTLADSVEPSKTQTFLSVVSTDPSPTVAGEQVAESTKAEERGTGFFHSLIIFIKNIF